MVATGTIYTVVICVGAVSNILVIIAHTIGIISVTVTVTVIGVGVVA